MYLYWKCVSLYFTFYFSGCAELQLAPVAAQLAHENKWMVIIIIKILIMFIVNLFYISRFLMIIFDLC
jgi:heme/copper-type cytochrome/quinol oxidase subunit 2